MEGGRGSGSSVFPLNCFENPPRRGGVQWKRIILGREGEEGPASQYWTLFKNDKRTGSRKMCFRKLFLNLFNLGKLFLLGF